MNFFLNPTSLFRLKTSMYRRHQGEGEKQRRLKAQARVDANRASRLRTPAAYVASMANKRYSNFDFIDAKGISRSLKTLYF